MTMRKHFQEASVDRYFIIIIIIVIWEIILQGLDHTKN